MLSSVAEYLKNHFWEEEKQMEKNKFPGYIEHKKEHGILLQKVTEIFNKIGKDEALTIKNVTEYLIVWYMEHLVGLDREMGEHFKEVI